MKIIKPSETRKQQARRELAYPVGDGIVNDRAKIQRAIDLASAAGGGEVVLPRPKVAYNIGTQGLVLYSNVVLRGEVGRFAGNVGNNGAGVTLRYSGTGAAIYGQYVTDVHVDNIDIDMTAATGAVAYGLRLTGVWKTTVRNVTVRGIPPSKGEAIYMDTSAGWGGQHNLLEQIECADGVIHLGGTGPTDAMTTTVLNTVRGCMYKFSYAQVVCINATAEEWPVDKYAYEITGNGTRVVLLGCDIENTQAAAKAFYVDTLADVKALGTIWVGFAGTAANRVTGGGRLGGMDSYGAVNTFVGALVAGTPMLVDQKGDANAVYLEDYIDPVSIVGAAQSGARMWKRMVNGQSYIDHRWRNHVFTDKTITTNATTKQTVWTIPVPSGSGLRVSITATGTQVGNNQFSNERDCRVISSGGALTLNIGTQVSCGDLGQIGFEASGLNLLVTWTPTTANASTPLFTMEIKGPWIGYT